MNNAHGAPKGGVHLRQSISEPFHLNPCSSCCAVITNQQRHKGLHLLRKNDTTKSRKQGTRFIDRLCKVSQKEVLNTPKIVRQDSDCGGFWVNSQQTRGFAGCSTPPQQKLPYSLVHSAI
jgi:hypothetical protein